MSQQASDKRQISLLVSLCLSICGTTLVKAGSLFPWREDPENGSGGCPGTSQELALLHFFLCLPGIWGDSVRNTQVRFLPVSLRAAGSETGLTLWHLSLGLGAQWGPDLRRQPVTGLWERW